MPRRSFSRRILAGGAAAAAFAQSGCTAAAPAEEAPSQGKAVGAPTQGKAVGARTQGKAVGEGEVRRLRLYAEKLTDGRLGYGFEKGKASVPGPLIELTEGDTLHVEFENTLDVATGLHVHGLDYGIGADGTKLNRSTVEPGATRTYTWRTHAPGRRRDGSWRPGSAGYWHYHDHAVGTDHGTAGIRKGLYGPVVVRRRGDILPDKQFTIVFNDMTINNTSAPDTPTFTATVGDRVEIIMITHGDAYHTFHLHGHRWADNRTGLLQGPDDPSRIIDTRITGPAESFGFQVIAGEDVGAGAWMYHCHVQTHSDRGMAGLFLVAEPDGTVPGHEAHH
ncbi:multicopper oxidase domain-containing protein [Streptomyces sp. bgisy100]|uniref:multicopper oxidase domain-containing protein n=1 Tax=Streptomyces sp. bgisy100 TaxID=3413783 RepID=UPI003D75620D